MQVKSSPKSVLAVATLLVLFSGCQQAQVFDVSSLPNQFQAPHTVSVNNIDFSKLARGSERAETLRSGDVVDVQVATGIEEEELATWQVRLDDSGVAAIPVIGAVSLAGLDFTRAEQAIRFEGVRRGKYIAPNVSIAIRERRSINVTVLGAVARQGTLSIPVNNANLLEALTRAGNLTEEASTIVEIRHPPRMVAQASYAGGNAPRIHTIDLAKAQFDPNVDLRVEDGSTVVVRRRGERFVSLIGLVRKRGQYEMPVDKDLHLLEAISLADGRTLQIADKVHIIRRIPNQPNPVVIEVSVKSAKSDPTANIRLAPGDVVSVEETMVTMVVGTIRDSVGFGFTSGIPGL
jgi:polysaccharide export outer membrane protein